MGRIVASASAPFFLLLPAFYVVVAQIYSKDEKIPDKRKNLALYLFLYHVSQSCFLAVSQSVSCKSFLMQLQSVSAA